MTPLLIALALSVAGIALACLAAFAAYLLEDSKPDHVSESDWQRITIHPIQRDQPACIHHVDQRARVTQKREESYAKADPARHQRLS